MTAQHVSPLTSEARSLPRTHLFLSATIRFDRGCAPIRLRDLSASGARIEGAILPAVGAAAQITRGALNAAGTVKWRGRKDCGFRFDQPLPVDDWMPPRLGREQQRVDELVEIVKASGALHPFDPPTSHLDTLREALPQRLAEELAYVGRLLESLGEDLCNEPLIVARHAEKLQNLDIGSQILGHLAALLVAEHPERAVDAIGMDSLRKRLLRVRL